MKAKSHIFSEMRGTVGGITYTANRFAPIIARQYVNPVNPSTSFQGEARNAFGVTVLSWRLLAPTTRDKWNDWASVQGIVGGGRQAFISAGSLRNYLYSRLKVATPFNEKPPTIDGVPYVVVNFKPYGGAVGTTGITVQFENLASIPQEVAYWNGVQVSGSRNYYDAPWLPETLVVATIPPVSIIEKNITDLAFVEGQRLFIRVMPFLDEPTPFDGQINGNGLVTFDVLQTAAI